MIQEGKRRLGGDRAEESQALRTPHRLRCWGRASLPQQPPGSAPSLPAPRSMPGPRAGPALSAPRNTGTGASCAPWAYEAAASGPARLPLDVLKPARSVPKRLPSGPRQAPRPRPRHRPEEGAGRPAGPPCPAPAQEAREGGEARPRPRRRRPRAGQRRGEPRGPSSRRPPAPAPPGGEGKRRCHGRRLQGEPGAPRPRRPGAELGPGWGAQPVPGPASPRRRSPSPACPRPHRLLTGNADKLNTAGITAICSGYRCRY